MTTPRKLLRQSGISIFLVLLVLGLAKNYILIPIMSKLWGWTLMTTPDGFVSNANILTTLAKSPWIVLIGFALVLLYALFAMLEISAAIVGIAYVDRGQNIKMIDLFRRSMERVGHAAQPKNWLVLVYAAVVLPLTDLFQASEMVKAFVMPEYIQEFIDSKTSLVVVNAVLMVAAFYLALRWLYMLPSFCLKDAGFAPARKESLMLTRKGWLLNGIKMGLYQLLETIRWSILPYLLIIATCIGCYYAVSENPYAFGVITNMGLQVGIRLVRSIVGRLVYISIMCYLVFSYQKKLAILEDESGSERSEFDMPELTRQSKRRGTALFGEFVASVVVALYVAVSFFFMLYMARTDSSVVEAYLNERVPIVAHKGYSSEAPENTMPAFALADECGNADYIELDVWSSRDGIPVVVHNETITAATGRSGHVYDYTYEELKQIPAPYAMEAEAFPDAYIPSLEEVMAAYADSTPLLIEIKGYAQDPELPAKIVALMDKYDCKYTSMIHSQDYGALHEVKLIDPGIKCGLIMAFVTGDCYDLPCADFFSVEHTFVTDSMVNALHQRGKEVYVWTVNYTKTAGQLRYKDIDGVITDYPDSIAKYVETIDLGEYLNIALDGETSTIDIGAMDQSSDFEKGEY